MRGSEDTLSFTKVVASAMQRPTDIGTRRGHGGHPANQRATGARKDKGKPSLASLRLRERGKMPDAKSGRVHILRQLAVPGGVAAEDTGNHFLLRLTRRSQRCRSGSEISGARV